MKRHAFRRSAQDDLSAIHDYLMTNVSLDHADDLVDRVEATAVRLARMPGIGAPHPELGEGIRMHLCGQYRLFYRVRGDILWIERVLHTARRLPFEALDEP
jgi:plasmid stabilization system protein ParE